MTTIDWQAMMANSTKIGEPVPAGDYLAVAEDAESGTAKNGHDPQWKVKWRLIGGPQNNRRVFDQFTLATGTDDKAATTRGFFFRDMKSLGLDENFFAQMPANELIAQRLNGIQAMITVSVNGRWNNVDGYALAGAGGGMTQPQPQQQAGFQQAPLQQPQGGFAPQPQPGFGQPQPQGYPQQPAAAPQSQFQQPAPQQMPQAPMQAGFPQAPQAAPVPEFGGQPMAPQGFAPQQPGFEQQAPAPQPQPPTDPNQNNGGQQFTPQPRPPF